MNKQKLESLKKLVSAYNLENQSVDTYYILEVSPFQRGQYHVEISSESVIYDSDLAGIVDWARVNNCVCYASARRNHVYLNLQ